MGAWIEILFHPYIPYNTTVAPLVGAWIEIVRAGKSKKKNASLLSWERGLKFALHLWLLRRLLSLLSWERGLKLRMDEFRHTTEEVAPLVGAWIEIWLLLSFIGVGIVSLLSWERGLK